MKHRYMKVTYCDGIPLAAYLYLSRNPGDTSARIVKHEKGLLIDYAADGRAIGIEIIAPTKVSLEALNRALAVVKAEPATAEELGPLAAA